MYYFILIKNKLLDLSETSKLNMFSGVARVIGARGHDTKSAPLLGPTESGGSLSPQENFEIFRVYMVHFLSIWYFNEIEYRQIILYTIVNNLFEKKIKYTLLIIHDWNRHSLQQIDLL
jgi:hypothetical protein